MSTTETTAPNVRRHSIWRWILVGLAAGATALALAIYNAVTLSREAVALRNEVAASLHVPTKTIFQASAGPLLLGAVRMGLHFVHDVPADARDALAAVRRASVGVYRLHGTLDAKTRAQLFVSADAAMNRRGWVRIVGVNDREDTVLIYTPAKAGWGGSQRVCLAICNGEDFVVVSATAAPGPLMEIASRHRDEMKL